MAKVLVTYATMAGSTAEVAEAVGEELAKSGLQVDVRPIGEVPSVEGYDGVVVGGPMIMGWHRQALGFLKRHRAAFQRVPLAVFMLAVSLTETGEREVDGMPVTVDEKLPRAPQTPGRLGFKERYARLVNYVRPALKAVRPAQPASVGVFGGRLEYGRLKWWAVLFAMVIIGATAGDRRNWPAIRGWAAELPAEMGLEVERPTAEAVAEA